MNHPLSTGQVARLLGTTEPHVAELVRRGRVKPRPRIVAGRRLWQLFQVLQAAAALGLPSDALQAQLEQHDQLSSDPEGGLQ